MTRKRPTFDNDTLRLNREHAAMVRGVVAERDHSLLIHHRHGTTAVALKDGDMTTVGREAPADVVIDDPSLSRRHASFSLRGAKLLVCDLGSTNGTQVNGARISQATVAMGDVVQLGDVQVTAHMRPAPTLHGLMSHDALRVALEREIVCARHFGDALALLMVRLPGANVAGWWSGLVARARPVDLCASYSGDVVMLSWPRTDTSALEARARGLIDALPDHALRFGAACFPSSAASLDELVDAAHAALRRTRDDARLVIAPSLATGRPQPTPEDARRPVASSVVMRELFALVDRLAESSIAVLLVGETGSGKEVVARALHARGARREGPLVCVNCGAIPAQLVESTLFGHERGAFTGASQSSDGVFGAADGGTVLLDEIGELPSAAQVALLRVLETKTITRVGASTSRAVDVRVIAATHKNLDAMCDEGTFRRDLYYRLNTMVLDVPPLRARREEIAELAMQFLEQAAAAEGRALHTIAPSAMDLLTRYAWPGNVRELKNAIDRAAVIARGSEVVADDLPAAVRGTNAAESEDDVDADLRARLRRYETRLIETALAEAGGNQKLTAESLGVPLRTLVHKLKTLDIKR
jgi:DNA-binding NtrC family response regulator